jgi:hypothetical protein
MGIVTFIEKAKKLHGEKYDYSQTEYVNANDKLSVICPDHGEFFVLPNNHLRGVACKNCMDEFKTSTLEDFLSKSKVTHGGRYDYSSVNYINNNTTVKIVCREHGLFEQFPRGHASSAGNGCPICNKASFWDLSSLSSEQLAEMNGVYVLILENRISGDQIVKVGISKRLKRRCKEIEFDSKDYIVKPLSYYPQILSDAIKVETRTHQELACYSEQPSTRFAGETECFSIECLPILVNLGLLESEQLERLSEGYELLDVTT